MSLAGARGSPPAGGRGGRCGLHGVGTERAGRERRRGLLALGRSAPPDAPPGSLRGLRAVRARHLGGCALQVPHRGAGRRAPTQGRSVRPGHGAAAEHCLARNGVLLPVGRRGVDGEALHGGRAALAGLHLRGSPRLLGPRPRGGESSAHLPGDRPEAGRACPAKRIQPCRVSSPRGTSVHRDLGLPGQRLLRPDRTLWHAGRLPLSDRRAATGPGSA